MEIRTFTVGPAQENCYIARREGRPAAFVIDPGDEAEMLIAAVGDLGLQVEAILLTHCHFDHTGAVATLARATGAPVYCPELEVDMLVNINDYVLWPGFGPFEGHQPEHVVRGGERLSVAGYELDVLFTPGHSPGHVSYSVPTNRTVFSGDVLFQGSIGRTDLPGADHPTLMSSLTTLLETLPDETSVLPGHMGRTTLGHERRTNPWLLELARAR